MPVPKQKLIRATTATCPEKKCGSKLTKSETPNHYYCEACGWADYGNKADWGYYERDISGVVEDLKRWLKEGQHMHAVYVVAKEDRVLGWIKELEPTEGKATRH